MPQRITFKPQRHTFLSLYLGLALTLVAAVIYAFAPILANEFVNWDDGYAILENAALQGPGAECWSWAWSTRLLGVYQPIAWLALRLQYLKWSLDPHGYHLVSLALHTVNASLAFLLAWRLRHQATARREVADLWLCCGVAAFFALHPARVEAVAWVSCQPYLLSTTFALLSCLAYSFVSYGAKTRSAAVFWSLSLLLFTCSCLTKATGAYLASAVLAIDYLCLPQRRGIGRAVRLAPFLGIGLATMAVAVWARSLVGTEIFTKHLSMGERLLQALKAIGLYLRQIVLPNALSPFQPLTSGSAEVDASMVTATVVLMLCIWSAWRLRRRWPALGVWLGLSLVALAPTLGLVKIADTVAADRYTYIAILPFLGLCTAPWTLTLRWRARKAASRYIAGCILAIPLLIGLWALANLSRSQCLIWRDSVTLWTTAIARGAQDEAAVHNNLGTAYGVNGQWPQAEGEFREVLRLQPNYGLAYFNLGITLHRQGQLQAAKEALEHALSLVGDLPQAAVQLGRVAMDQKDVPEAERRFKQAQEWQRSIESRQ